MNKMAMQIIRIFTNEGCIFGVERPLTYWVCDHSSYSFVYFTGRIMEQQDNGGGASESAQDVAWARAFISITCVNLFVITYVLGFGHIW